MTLQELTTLEKLNDAFYQCKRISAWKESTQRYESMLLINNTALQDELRNGAYKVSPTSNFTINERGKLRNIEAPAMRDRIVQKILCKHILLPQLTPLLIYDNYASLPGRGTSFARARLERLLREYIGKHGTDGYILQIDIKQYFPSIDHEILKQMMHDKIHESVEIMDLIDYIVDSSSNSDKGLNLGSEAPQIFALFYLSKVDNYIKYVKGIRYYGRYMDDMFVIGNDKEELKELYAEIKKQLVGLKLAVNERKTHIIKLTHGFTFLQIKYTFNGYKIIKRPTHSKIVRARKRLKKYKLLYDKGLMSESDIYNAYKSWRNGMLKDCNTCKKSIDTMDKLYKELFLSHEKVYKVRRKELINKAFMEYYQ